MKKLSGKAVFIYKKGFVIATFDILKNFLSYAVFIEKLDRLIYRLDRMTAVLGALEFMTRLLGLIVLVAMLLPLYPLYFLWVMIYYYPITMIRLHHQVKALTHKNEENT